MQVQIDLKCQIFTYISKLWNYNIVSYSCFVVHTCTLVYHINFSNIICTHISPYNIFFLIWHLITIRSGSSWLFVTPFGMRSILDYINRKYGHPKIIVTENGVSDRNGTLNDADRVYFFRHYINNALQGIHMYSCTCYS